MFDLEKIITSIGYIGVGAIVFAESGLFIGAILPGDSLLFTAGLLASKGVFNIYFLIPLLFVCAFIGDQVGYNIGKGLGPRLFNKPNSRFFKQDHLVKAQKFFDKYGAKTIVLSRFVPAVRSFAPMIAGASKMKYTTFVIYNFFGALIWVLSMTLLGYFLGEKIPNIDTYILPIIFLIIILSLLPAFYQLVKEYLKNRKKKV